MTWDWVDTVVTLIGLGMIVHAWVGLRADRRSR